MPYDLILPLVTHSQGGTHNYFWVTARRISSLLGHSLPTTTVGLVAVAIASYAILLAVVFIQRRLRKRPREDGRTR